MCSWFLTKYICIITHTFFGTYLNVGKLGKNQLKDNVYKNWENMNHKYCIVIHDSFVFTQFQGTGMSFKKKKKENEMCFFSQMLNAKNVIDSLEFSS